MKRSIGQKRNHSDDSRATLEMYNSHQMLIMATNLAFLSGVFPMHCCITQMKGSRINETLQHGSFIMTSGCPKPDIHGSPYEEYQGLGTLYWHVDQKILHPSPSWNVGNEMSI
ncbi:uncharacterized protein V6R79_011260 [Siganus canaliculatus]